MKNRPTENQSRSIILLYIGLLKNILTSSHSYRVSWCQFQFVEHKMILCCKSTFSLTICITILLFITTILLFISLFYTPWENLVLIKTYFLFVWETLFLWSVFLQKGSVRTLEIIITILKYQLRVGKSNATTNWESGGN